MKSDPDCKGGEKSEADTQPVTRIINTVSDPFSITIIMNDFVFTHLMKNDTYFKVHGIANTGFSRTYIIEDHNSLMAVDVGSAGAARDIEYYIRIHLGRDIADLEYITATHFHIDHIGGIGPLLRRCAPATKVLFHRRVQDYLTGKKKISLIRNWFSGLMPASIVSARYVRRISHLVFMNMAGIPLPGFRNIVDLSFPREKISYFGNDGGKRYKLGYGDWDILETPGHTEDSISFYNEETGELICGDLIINIAKGGRGSLNRFHWRDDVIRNSFRYLQNTIEPSIIYPGHGDTIRNKPNPLCRVEIF